MQIQRSLIYLLIFISVLILLSFDKLRPIRVFAVYSSCKVVEKVGLVASCDQLPVVTILEQGKLDADSYGVEDPLALSLFFERYRIPEHVYAHRTNSPERAKTYAKYYQAFEFDAVWNVDQEALDIYHYPEHASMAFYFHQLVDIVPISSRLWLDLKNLTPEISPTIVGYLNRYFTQKKDRQRLIVESKNAAALADFHASGYKTSYYLPSPELLTGCEEHRSVQELIANINQWKTDFISFPYTQQQFVDLCVLPYVRAVPQLSWGGLPFAIPEGALERYQGYIVDHSLHLEKLE